MAPATMILIERRAVYPRRLEGNPGSWRDNATVEMFIIESWSQGFLVGALLIMACVTISNMRAGIFLHKLILLELFLAMSHGTFCFMSFDGYGWYLSSTAALLYLSWIVHNLVAWIKIKPFMKKTASRIFIGTLCLTVPPIFLQIVGNFLFFLNIDDMYIKIRPFEVLMRDPWWVYGCVLFFLNIKNRYTVPVLDLIKGHPRFAIMLLAMAFSLIFTILDLLASVVPSFAVVDGINPYWKLALVFKALTDVIILDDFKSCLDKLSSKIVETKTVVLPKPPPVPPKDHQMKERAVTITCNTARTSPTLVTSQSPKTSPREALRENIPGPKIQRSQSIRNKMGRIGSHLSPLSSMNQMGDDPISPSEKSPRSGGPHMIHVKMDLGLNKFVSSVVGRRPPSLQAESPLDPTWPRLTSLRRGQSVLSRGTVSTNTRSSRSSIPSMPERTPTSHGSMPTPRAM